MTERRGETFRWLCLLLSLGIGLGAATATVRQQQDALSSPVVEFEVVLDEMVMKDGVRLAVTYFRPHARTSEERFPVLLELLPYRKDDQFYLRDYPIHSYFAKRGYVVAKVDIRGTGSSEGTVPFREYSDAELDDAVEIIRQLAAATWSNGKVGMFGISWGGFNAIQVAMRRPEGLEAILALHASDDLFHDDVHYIDGILHVDEYELQIDMDNALPRSPDYLLDERYFATRFDAYPWFLTYLKQQRDGGFWRDRSLRWQYDTIDIPVYLIGGLLDGYRDTVPRMLENMKVPMRAVMGPWNHSFPDNGVPGPHYEWRHDAVRWWDTWLKGKKTGILEEPRFAVFVREGHRPDTALETTPGRWRYEDWPIERTRWDVFYPGKDHALSSSTGPAAVHRLDYDPTYGADAGTWWGEPTGDMRRTDAGGLLYDSPVLAQRVEIVGFPRVHLRVAADAPLAHWIVRLEDVHPDGMVSLVTGAGLNGSQRDSRLEPEPLVPGEVYDIEMDLHFTTWTFEPGHRMRLAVSNGLFPMFWPTPELGESELHVGRETTRLELPRIPREARPTPAFLPPEPRASRQDARYLEAPPRRVRFERDIEKGTARYEIRMEGPYEIRGRRHLPYETHVYETHSARPSESSYRGEAGHRIELDGHVIELRTFFTLRSSATEFSATFRRELTENEELIRERQWEEKIPRVFQ